MKYTFSALLTSLSLSIPALAHAQDLSDKGTMVFSADRLFGVTATHVSWEEGPFEADNDWTAIGFLSRSPASVFDLPRVGFDYLVIDHLSVGGSIAFYTTDPDQGPDYSGFLLSPRVGYLVELGRVVGIWPRGGFTFHSGEVGGTDENGFALTLECPFTFSPTKHFAFHVGPTFDIDMFGKREGGGPGGVDVDQNYRVFGLNAGLLGWF